MKRLTFPFLFFLATAALMAAPLAPNAAFVTINDAPLYQDNPDKSLKWLEALTLGDTVTLVNRTASFKESGKDRDFTRVKAPDGKEGWVRSQFVAAKAMLAVVKADEAIIFTEPRDVKATSRSASLMTVVAVLQDGSTGGFARIQGYDIPKSALYVDQTYLNMTDLTTSDADVQAAILYTVAMASKSPEVRKSLLKLASGKYGGSIFSGAIDLAMSGAPAPAAAAPVSSGAPAHLPVQMNKDLQGGAAVRTFTARLSPVAGAPAPAGSAVRKVTATSFLTEPSVAHVPPRIADGDLKTSWVEGVKGNGIGEKVFLFPDGGGAVTSLWIVPGFAISQAGWNGNNRVSTLTLRFVQVFDNGDYQVIEANGTDRFVLAMATDGGMVPFNNWQVFDLGADLWDGSADKDLVNAVLLEITEVDSKNAKYQDTAIAEVRLVP